MPASPRLRCAPARLAASLLLLLAACGRPEPTAPSVTPDTARRPLPGPVRDLIAGSMRVHGESMETLLLSALRLDYETTASYSSWLADEPHIPRPGTAPDSINRAIPASFFDLQDAMFDAADALTAAARRRDDPAMAAAFGRLAQSCIACHSVYLPRGPRGSR
jgi:cytochrome c'